MEAKVKDTARFKRYNFFDRNEFSKGEWSPVPAGFEEQAREESLLDIRELPGPLISVEDYEYMVEKEKKDPRRGRKRKVEAGAELEEE